MRIFRRLKDLTSKGCDLVVNLFHVDKQVGRGRKALAASIIAMGVLGLTISGVRSDNAPVAAYGIKNIAAAKNGGKVVSCTSELDANYWKVSNLIDGMVWDKSDPKLSNGWASKVFDGSGNNFPQDIILSFQDEKPKLIGQVVIDPTTPDGAWIGRWAREVEIFASTEAYDNPVSYKYVGTCKLINKGEKQVFSFAAVEAKYLKFRIRSNWGSDKYVGLGEIEVYEAIPDVGQLDQLISRLEQILHDLKKYREENQK